jgi:hypothetical protein
MTPWKATLDSLRTLSYRRLSSQFQFSLSAVTLEYLSQWFRTGLFSKPESVATLAPFGPIEGQKWFDRISSQ